MQSTLETTSNLSRLMTPNEVAELLQVTVQRLAVKRLEGSGPKFCKLSSGKFGAVRYARADVLDWLAKNTRRSTSDSHPAPQIAA